MTIHKMNHWKITSEISEKLFPELFIGDTCIIGSIVASKMREIYDIYRKWTIEKLLMGPTL